MTDAPDWLVPGAEVVIVAGRYKKPSSVLTIDRVMKRDVVLSNGDRWSLARLAHDGGAISKPGGTSWDPWSYLYPASHPAVHEAAEAHAGRQLHSECRTVARRCEDAIRSGAWDEARSLADRLCRLLANAPDAEGT